VNTDQKKVLPRKIIKALGNLKNKRIAIWGLAFKPNTDDIREAPSITIIEELLRAGANIIAYDPKAASEIKHIFGSRIDYARDKYNACQKADALVLVTEWSEFHQPNFKKLKQLLKKPILFDGRNIYDPVQLKKMGWTYYGIGR
jgi:UDPglucose 6-dehydrogenase